MTNLTEKWEAGELEEGWYYILNKNNTVRIEEANVWIGRYDKPFVGFDDDSGIKEVLAPIPSYEELQELKEYEKTIKSYNGMPIDYTISCETVNKLLDVKNKIKEENARLKELLKECNDAFEKIQKNYGYDDSAIELSEPVQLKIEEVLK